MKLRRDLMGLLLALGLGVAWMLAKDYQGARAILFALEKLESDKSNDAQETKPAVLVAFEELRKNAAKLSDEAAAQAWIAAYEELLSMTPKDEAAFQNQAWSESLQLNMSLSLPKSGAWELIQKEAQQRSKSDPKDAKALALRYFMAVLKSDFEEKATCETALLALMRRRKDIPRENQEHIKQQFGRATAQMKALSGEAKYVIEAFEQNLKESLNAQEDRQGFRSGVLEVPSLIQLAGPERAEALLKEAFKVKEGIRIQGPRELKLAKALFLKDPALLAVPHWDWINRLDDAALYQAMVKRFEKAPESNHGSRSKEDAVQIYVASLVAHGKLDEAVALVKAKVEGNLSFQLPSDILAELRSQGFGAPVYAFYHRLVSEWPQPDLWSPLIETASWQQKTPEVVELLKANLVKLNLPRQQALRPLLYQALLANDEVEEGVKVLREVLAKSNETNEEAQGNQLTVEYGNYLGHANLLVRLGALLEREDWKKEGLETLQKSIAKAESSQAMDAWQATESLSLLAEHGQGVWVESFVKQTLEEGLKNAKSEGEQWVESYTYQAKSWMMVLMGLYHQAGRYDEVLTLLDEGKYWGEDHLDALNESYGAWSIQELAVDAMLATGRKREAEAIVLQQLRKGETKDRYFEWLVKLQGQEALPILDELYSRDAFEERPLIWKAKLLLDAGKLQEAESTVKAAIAIDPSDGETGKNDRMRVYQVLGEIHKKKGEDDQAKTMEGVLAAIRLSENADDFWSAGLLKRAVGMYEKSLQHFADAYCIQSRLALRYREMNLPEKAAVHYRRAFELMPDSFGRIESHCFGCQGVFTDDQAQKIAEEVFEKLALEQPKKAQVFYLLGYLRESQDRDEEAAAAYRRAIQLDPQYLNALEKLIGLKEEIGMSVEERDDLALRWFALDPYDRNGGKQAFLSIKSVAKAWDLALEAQDRFEDPSGGPAYELKASQAFRLERSKAGEREPGFMRDHITVSPKDQFLRDAKARIQVISYAQSALRIAMRVATPPQGR